MTQTGHTPVSPANERLQNHSDARDRPQPSGYPAIWQWPVGANATRTIETPHAEDPNRFECLPKLLARNDKIDFAFLDGQHTFDYVLVDFFYVDKILSVGGIIVFDDLQYPSVRKVCRYVLTNLCYVSTDPKIADTRLRSRMISALAKVGPIAKAVRPEIRERDGALGIPNRRFMAIQKKAHDLIGEGRNTTRHWEAHNAF